ncbi:MAG: DUF3850 domain-containing protein [Candidatus Omnitrophica bacterium]|nr:DUF3850 domain-containing protein [Candidatus Omnitrophota bacterium]
MKVHTLKTWPDIYKDMVRGIKQFDYRKNDRDFQVGDTLRLREYIPERRGGRFTGKTLYVKVTYIIKDAPPAFGLPKGYCIMAFEKIGTKEEKE